jgi:hypothetical protein
MSRKVMAIAGGAIGLIVILAVALVVAIASSGDDDSDPAEASPTTFQGSPPEGQRPDPEELEEFRTCMEEQGVELPEPGEAPPANVEELQQAFEACRDLLPEGLIPPGGAPGGQGPVIVPGG